MGFHIHWIGFKDLPLTEAAAALGLAFSGQSAEVPDYSISGASVGDWSIVIYDYYKHDTAFLAQSEVLKQLSDGREIVVINVDENVMYTYAERWKYGELQWEVVHDGQQDILHLEVDGVPPDWFEGILDENLRAQEADNNNVDYMFEIPAEMTGRITGFWHDRGSPEDGFFELKPISAD